MADNNLTEIGYVHLHGSMNFASKNFKEQVEATMPGFGGVKMFWNEDKRRLEVNYNNTTGWIPETNIKVMVPGPARDRKIHQVASPMVLGAGASAQVETPMSHVHAGPGKGKAGK